MRTILFILFPLSCFSQTIDTLQNAKAFNNTFDDLAIYSVASNSDVLDMGMNKQYNADGSSKPLQAVRVDVSSNVVTYKDITGVPSNASWQWAHALDSLGNIYISYAGNPNRLLKFRLKDSIDVQYISNPFVDGMALVYCMGLGTDGHMYFGGKGNAPYFSEYDPVNNVWYKHNAIVDYDYTLAITGNKDYIYLVYGQSPDTKLIAFHKSDSTYTTLMICSNVNRPTLETDCHGQIWAKNGDTQQWYAVNGTTLTPEATWSGCRNAYYEVNGAPGQPTLSTYYNKDASQIIYTLNGVQDAVDVTSATVQNNLRLIIPDRNNTDRLFYFGDYYGTVNGYSIGGDSSWVYGTTGYNVYSWKRLSDSIILLGNYPSGALLSWNLNKSWTVNKFINGKIVDVGDTNANPKLVTYFKNSAGFHHLESMLQIGNKLVCAGDVIRIGNTCSVGTWDVVTGTVNGYDYNKINGLQFISLVQYKNYALMSTSNGYGGTPKIYYYNPETNTMDDSLDLGFTNYGALNIIGDQLLGVANNHYYKVNLITKSLIYDYTGGSNTTFAFMMQDAVMGINGGALPAQFWRYRTVPYTNYIGLSGTNVYYSFSLKYLIRSSGICGGNFNLNTAYGKEQYITNFLQNK